jgi:hypothetical protein
MNTIDFCYWLQGHFELNPDTPLTTEQTKVIKNHLHLVFKHEIDPLRESQTITSVLDLNEAHTGTGYSPSNDVLVRC